MTGHTSSFLLLSILTLATIIMVFGMKYFSGTRQVLLRLAGEDAYRELAVKSAAAQAASAATFAALQAELTEVKAKLAAIQTVLQEVG